MDEPVASLLSGDPGKSEPVVAKADQHWFDLITSVAWSGDHLDPDLAGKGLVVDYFSYGIRVMDGAGKVRSWVGHQASDHLGQTGFDSCFGRIRTLSVRPTGQGPNCPWPDCCLRMPASPRI
jgi:hypothetical protein